MEPNVHWFASNQVDGLPATRRDNEQYDYNGTGPKAFPPTYAQQSSTTEDIANHEVRPDVWVEVHKMINPTSNWRTQEAPKSTYEPYSPAGTGPKEKEWANPTAKEVEDKIKKAKAVPEETKEEADAKKEAKPVKKPNPDYEGDDLAEPKESEEPKEELALQTVLYDSVNHL